MMDIEAIGKKCCACLKEKILLLETYTKATTKIKEALESNDIEGLNRHINARQNIVGRIEQIDKKVDQFLKGSGFAKEKLSEKAKDLFGSYFDQIKRVLESIAGLDKGCLALARAEQNLTKSEILKVQHGRRVARGYKPTSHQTPRFLDVKR